MKKFFYRVCELDTVLSVSIKLCVPPQRIIKLNNLNCEVCEGDLLYIDRIENAKKYCVKPFDCLESISRVICVDINDICAYNCIENVYFGQIIYY